MEQEQENNPEANIEDDPRDVDNRSSPPERSYYYNDATGYEVFHEADEESDQK